MHIVHYSTKYASLGDAVKEPGGLAVIGVMFEVRYHTLWVGGVPHPIETDK